MKLPIHDIREDLVAGLRSHRPFILQAPTGSGKSTQVPQFLVDGVLPNEGLVIVLQPRRIAARLLARRIASERGVKLGEEVGYQVRLDSCWGRNTRILLVTEGILLRRMLGDPQLSGVSAILFDEFHERNLYSDLSLARARQLQELSRPDLILGVMSATLDGDALENYLNPCLRLQCEGRTYPVEISYNASVVQNREVPVWEKAANVFVKAARQGLDGNVLVFMPGAFEIHRTLQAIGETPEAKGYDLLALHGDLPPEQQDRAVDPGERPKVIVSTNVAETSLTLPGIALVIDSGLARIPVYDPRRGVNTILVQAISQASADQRAGRAGRERPGRCIRLWGGQQHLHRPQFEKPEIQRIDLSETALTLLAAGEPSLTGFPWFEAPESLQVLHATTLLTDLGALEPASGRITDLGRRMAAFPMHPRFSRLFLEASNRGCLEAAAWLAALAQDRAILLGGVDKQTENRREQELADPEMPAGDLFLELNAALLARSRNYTISFCRELGIHAGNARNAEQLARQFLGIASAQGLSLNPTASTIDWNALAYCLMVAFSDQIAHRLDQGTLRCGLPHGRKGTRRRESLVESEWFVSVEVEERDVQGTTQIMLGRNVPILPEWIEASFPSEILLSSGVSWDPWQKRVRKRAVRLFRDLVLWEKESATVEPDEAAEVITREVLAGNLRLKNWNEKAETLIARIEFISRHFPEYEVAPINEDDRPTLIGQICYGASCERDLQQAEVLPTILDWLNPAQRPLLDTCAPESISLEGKGRLRIRYEKGKAILSAKIQHLYDVKPILLGGRVGVVYELLAPNQRPVQITEDLEAFWQSSYPSIRKDLKGRYPKHEWR